MRFLAAPALILFIALASSANAEGDLTFRVRVVDTTIEQVSEGIHLFVETDYIYPCTNYRIPNQIDISDNEIAVTMGEPVEPDGCFLAIGPGYLREPLAITEGSYTLRLDYAGKSDAYGLVIDGDQISLTPISPSFSVCSENLRHGVFDYASKRSFACLSAVTASPTPSPTPSATAVPSQTPAALPDTGGSPANPEHHTGPVVAVIAAVTAALLAGYGFARRLLGER